MAASDYITLSEFKDTMEIGSTYADPDVQRAITAASRAVDSVTGRQFYPGNPGEIRYYTAIAELDGQAVYTDDILSVTAVKTDPDGDLTWQQPWPSTNYVLGPQNNPVMGLPYSFIRTPEKKGLIFPLNPYGVQVTGSFGWSTPPEQVKLATGIIASRLLLRARQAPFGVVSAGIDGTAVRISRFDPDLALLLDPLNHSQLVT
jgi:hypothetical protein